MSGVMSSLSVQQWHDLVAEAESRSAIALGEELESYLVFLLMRFMRQPDLVGSVMAPRYLSALSKHGSQRREALRDVGDICLLFSGFFPGVARRRRVRVSYYVDLGQGAYGSLAEDARAALGSLFSMLANRFVELMDTLQTIRCFNPTRDLFDPLLLQESWADTGSRFAYARLHELYGDDITLLLDRQANRSSSTRH